MSLLLSAARAALSLLPDPVPARQRRLAGRRARVDGIDFTLPVDSRDTPALVAAFTCDARAAAALLPGGEVHPLRLLRGRSLFVVTVVDYTSTDIGRYVEHSLAVACTHGPDPAPPLLPGLLQGTYGTGQYVLDLPVSSEVSVHGGKGIWGMPKHQANLDFLVTPTTVSSQYDVDGLLACRIAIARPRPQALPVRMSSTNYCAFRGMLMKSSISVTGLADVAFGASAQAQLLLGEAPQVAGLKTLGLSSRPLFTAYLPSTSGVLDDHVESWFLSGEHEAPAGGDDLRSVTGLGLSQDWLDAPRTLGVPTGWAP